MVFFCPAGESRQEVERVVTDISCKIAVLDFCLKWRALLPASPDAIRSPGFDLAGHIASNHRAASEMRPPPVAVRSSSMFSSSSADSARGGSRRDVREGGEDAPEAESSDGCKGEDGGKRDVIAARGQQESEAQDAGDGSGGGGGAAGSKTRVCAKELVASMLLRCHKMMQLLETANSNFALVALNATLALRAPARDGEDKNSPFDPLFLRMPNGKLEPSMVFARTPSQSHVANEALNAMTDEEFDAATMRVREMAGTPCLSLRVKGKCKMGERCLFSHKLHIQRGSEYGVSVHCEDDVRLCCALCGGPGVGYGVWFRAGATLVCAGFCGET